MKKRKKGRKMEFRPCIDIHNGKVKQIVGDSLLDKGDVAEENFISSEDAAYYARFYERKKLKGGHVIMLNGRESNYYERTKFQAMEALKTYPKGFQAGGGIRRENAGEFLDAGASHVIVTSYIFSGSELHYKHLEEMKREVGKEHLVLDLSCRKKDGRYYIVTDRWKNFTNLVLSHELLKELESYCDEYLIHGVDVEGKKQGMEEELIKMLGEYGGNPITYAGGVSSYGDIEMLKKFGKNKVHVTIGSALDLFGGSLEMDKVIHYVSKGIEKK